MAISKEEKSLRQEIVEIGRRLYALGLVSAMDGNISCRLPQDRILITPSGVSLGYLEPDGLVEMLLSDEKTVSAGKKPSSEWPMHFEIYRQRPDVNAVVHAHPPITTAFSVTGHSLGESLLPEVVILLGKIPTARYATPSTPENARVVRDLIRVHDVIMLDHHGAVSAGADLQSAFFKMEKLEHTAKTVFAAKLLGTPKPLPPEEVAKLVQLGRELGYRKG